MKYLKYFDQFTKNTCKGYRLLVFDGYSSHLTQQFIDYCQENKIRPYRLPPYSTYYLQPYNISIFSTIKLYFKQEIQVEVFLGASKINKADFFSFFQRFHNKTFNSKRIYQSAFKKTSLILWNPIVALTKMKEYQKYLKERP